MHAGQSLWSARGSQVSEEFAFSAAPFLSVAFCSCCVVCSDDRITCKRGSLVPADKRMLRVTTVQLTLDFKGDLV